MPGGDRTGPVGMGPRTGRGAGFCAGYGIPGFMNSGCGRGVFGGNRGGLGRRHRFFATGIPGWRWFSDHPFSPWPAFAEQPAPREELDVLKEQSRFLEDRLNALRMRMDTLSREKKTE